MPTAFDPEKPWYHGSPQKLTTLRAGSTVTQNKELARIFSHKPAIVIGDDADGHWKHTGPFARGFLYRVVGQIAECDIEVVPHSVLRPGTEWNTKREFPLEPVSETHIVNEELLTKHELLHLATDGRISRETADRILKNQDLPD